MRTLADIAVGQYYRHHKGDYYCVRAVATSAETGETVIVYSKAIHPDCTWFHRPRDFLQLLPDGRERFARCDVMEVVRSVDPRLLEGVYFVNANELGTNGRR